MVHVMGISGNTHCKEGEGNIFNLITILCPQVGKKLFRQLWRVIRDIGNLRVIGEIRNWRVIEDKKFESN